MPNLKTQTKLAKEIEIWDNLQKCWVLQNKILMLAADNDDLDMYSEALFNIKEIEDEMRRILK